MPYYFVLGTRPEVVKLSPVIASAERNGLEFLIVHSGQHYDFNLDKVFFQELALPPPSELLAVGSGTHAVQTAAILTGVEKVLQARGSGVVVVEGDTNTTLGGALAGSKVSGVAVAHVEAGCRSFNRAMPEETNRIAVDHVSDILFAATQTDMENLAREGLAERAHYVGSTGIEACLRHAPLASKKSALLERLGLARGSYALCTLHRQENTQDPARLRGIIEGLRLVSENLPVLVPVHPRTAAAMGGFGLQWPRTVLRVPPLGYFDFLNALMNAKFVMTDSGGVQEEAAVLGTRCFTLRDETEWTFTLEQGANTLVGADSRKILDATLTFLHEGTTPTPLRPLWPTGKRPSEAIVEELLGCEPR